MINCDSPALPGFVRYTHSLGSSKRLKTTWKHHLTIVISPSLDIFLVFSYFVSQNFILWYHKLTDLNSGLGGCCLELDLASSSVEKTFRVRSSCTAPSVIFICYLLWLSMQPRDAFCFGMRIIMLFFSKLMEADGR